MHASLPSGRFGFFFFSGNLVKATLLWEAYLHVYAGFSSQENNMFRVIAFAPNGAIYDEEFQSAFIAGCVEEELLSRGYTLAEM